MFHNVFPSLTNLVPLYIFGQYYKLKFYTNLQYTDLETSHVWWECVQICESSLSIKSDVGIGLPKSFQKARKVGSGSVEEPHWEDAFKCHSQNFWNVPIHFRDVPSSHGCQLLTLALFQPLPPPPAWET